MLWGDKTVCCGGPRLCSGDTRAFVLGSGRVLGVYIVVEFLYINIPAAGAVYREFSYICWPKTGQHRSKKKVQGRGSYLTKYGLTIYFLDPDHAPKTFRKLGPISLIFRKYASVYFEHTKKLIF